MKDTIVEEVRKHRLDHTRKFGGDLAAICEDLRSIQNTSGHKVVRLAPKKIEPTKASIGPDALTGKGDVTVAVDVDPVFLM